MQAWEHEKYWLLPTSGLLQQKLLLRQRLPHCFLASSTVGVVKVSAETWQKSDMITNTKILTLDTIATNKWKNMCT
jgi:hypothetical protein